MVKCLIQLTISGSIYPVLMVGGIEHEYCIQVLSSTLMGKLSALISKTLHKSQPDCGGWYVYLF